MKKSFEREIYIVDIPNEHSVYINVGTKDGAQENDVFSIIGITKTIVDPVTKEKLEELNGEKAQIRVSKAFQNVSLCVNREYAMSPMLNSLHLMQSAFSTNTPARLNIDPNYVSGDIEDEEIRVGDKVSYVGNFSEEKQIVEIEDTAND